MKDATFIKLTLFYFKKHWLDFIILLITITIASVMMGAYMADTLSKITQAIFDNSFKNLIYAIICFLCLVIIDFINGVLYRCRKFKFIKHMTTYYENIFYMTFEKQEYWGNEEEVLGHMRKNIPSVISSYIDLVCFTYQTFIVVISGGIYAFYVNHVALIASVVLTGIMLLFSYRALGRLKNLYDDFSEHQGMLYNRLWEQVRNREIAPFLISERVVEPYADESRSFIKTLLHIKKKSNIAELFATFGSTIIIILVALIGGIFVLKEKLMISKLVALIIVIPTISVNLFGVPEIIANWKAVIGRGRPIADFLMKEGRNYEKRELLNCDIERINVKNLTFGYNKENVVLKDISLTFTKGYYAIAGVSGCGKTTFIKILARLLPEEGESIYINEKSLRYIDRNSYWKQISYVSQEPVILQDTLLYNIVMSNEVYDENRLNKAIADAQLDLFLTKQPEGLNTVIVPDSISKGEAQKINIARGLYRKAKVLLLDEITSAIDPQSEIKIVHALKERAENSNQIILFISHRIYPLSLADIVVFFENGEIHGVGSHRNLIESNENYKIMTTEVIE